ncbi:glyoxylase-like metal-dependent hydrolase (beta-lactamase superfamily II) [Paenibacillus forsythiae]|uniref:Glyoxylase-like metal-dependent hydrolase (Beta-lactamase superfamily II) n=1 Tax=Paenibacillus forsythiae TaxID=365616 RepID=A0ABU3H5U4_9BACL|nr:glyoxylase-like metal-dependent hydrolase (beta-lactamase superfamily II) [Paenibacillus forsythiae]
MKLSDSWFTVEEIDMTTYAISEYGHWEKVHSYLLLGAEFAVLIDTGIGIGNIKRVVEQITSLPIKVITTHVHWDHIGNHELFDEVYVHELEEDWLENGIPGLPIEITRRNVGRGITIPVPDDFSLEEYRPFRGKATAVLRDKETMDLGDRILTFIHTPGHSPGHLCIYEEERGYLYTGDLIYKGTLFAFYPTTDPLLFIKSVEKINQIEYITKILPGHNELELNRRFLSEVNKACQELLDKGLAKHGTGIHDYKDVKIYF